MLINYESKVLLEDHEFKMQNKGRFSYKGLKYFYKKNNLRYKFGILLYIIYNILITTFIYLNS